MGDAVGCAGWKCFELLDTPSSSLLLFFASSLAYTLHIDMRLVIASQSFLSSMFLSPSTSPNVRQVVKDYPSATLSQDPRSKMLRCPPVSPTTPCVQDAKKAQVPTHGPPTEKRRF